MPWHELRSLYSLAHSHASWRRRRRRRRRQGAALLVYNDGVFSEADFKSISHIGDSGKREQVCAPTATQVYV